MIYGLRKILLLGIILFLISCEFNIEPVPVPVFEPSNLKGSKSVTDFIKDQTEGIYMMSSQFKPFGDSLVLKWNKDILSVFTGKNTAYLVLQTGYKNEDIFCEGYWRHANSEQTNIVSLTVLSENGGKDLVNNIVPAEIILTGLFKGYDGDNLHKFMLKKVRNISPAKKDFRIIAHKGGGRNIDRLPHSENTIEMIKYAENLGANGIEIDVRLTKDKVPILFHDNYVSLRTVNNEYFIGKIKEYTYSLLKNNAPLKFGETIPTLDDALKAVVEETNLKVVWLDMKDLDAVPIVVPIQNKYLKKAIDMGRELKILIGVPDVDIYEKVKALPNYRNVPTLCELDESYLEELNSLVWGPRWSLGLVADRIKHIHDLGKKAFVWTLDDPKLISKYIKDTDFDGIVTNYSPVVAYEYYISK